MTVGDLTLHDVRRAIRSGLIAFGLISSMLLSCGAASAAEQFIQQGPKLVGTGAEGTESWQGRSAALSANGNVAIVGGPYDNGEVGAVWIFTRTNGVWSQWGTKLVGTGAVGSARQGFSVALSADGNTAIVGGPADNGNSGAAWVFIRVNDVWIQQGEKLVGTGAVGTGVFRGNSVDLSDDGNTAIVGGWGDDGQAGAAWVFIRSNGVWTQQGAKLVGTGAVGDALQGVAVALSADGNTAIVGGSWDNNQAGATWVFTRGGGVWTQQGAKLIGTGAVGSAAQGASVALSADGNTAVVGGHIDNANTGAAWVFTRSGGVWSQHGSKLVGSGPVGNAQQGSSVALSGDGNTAMVGARVDNAFTGAAWVFARSLDTWTQLGPKLVGAGAEGTAERGEVALSADGNTAILGGYRDNVWTGAAWVFVRSNLGAAHDFNCDSTSDILWRHTSGAAALWLMNAATIASAPGIGGAPVGWSMVGTPNTLPGTGDFNGDCKTDILWHHTSGAVALWLMDGSTITSAPGIGGAPTSWTIVGTGDFNGDARSDILWLHSSGAVAIWLMDGSTITDARGIGAAPGWSIVGIGDFDGDIQDDILWRHSSGALAIWFMDGGVSSQAPGIGGAPTDWAVVATGDFNGDDKADILWRHTSGAAAIWFMDRTTITSAPGIGGAPIGWSVVSTGDYDGDLKSDILWRHATGAMAVWLMDGATIKSAPGIGGAPVEWAVVE